MQSASSASPRAAAPLATPDTQTAAASPPTRASAPAAAFPPDAVDDTDTVGLVDAAENELSVKHGWRIMSVYTIAPGVTVWLITEADRRSSTFLLPEDY